MYEVKSAPNVAIYDGASNVWATAAQSAERASDEEVFVVEILTPDGATEHRLYLKREQAEALNNMFDLLLAE